MPKGVINFATQMARFIEAAHAALALPEFSHSTFKGMVKPNPVRCAKCSHPFEATIKQLKYFAGRGKPACPCCNVDGRTTRHMKPEPSRTERAARAEVLRQKIDETRAKLARLLEERAALVATLQDERSELPDER